MNSKGELTFGVRCEDSVVKSGYSIPIEEDVEVVVTYDGVKADIYANKSLRNSVKISFSFKCGGHLDIGGYTATKSEVWNGLINYIVIYDSAFDSKAVAAIKAPKKRSAKGGAGGGDDAGGGGGDDGGGGGGGSPSLPTSGTLLT
jgi:uncharacterized membrane protein YgcG